MLNPPLTPPFQGGESEYGRAAGLLSFVTPAAVPGSTGMLGEPLEV